MNRIILRTAAVIAMLAGLVAAAATAQGQDAPPQEIEQQNIPKRDIAQRDIPLRIVPAALTLHRHPAAAIDLARLTAASDFTIFLDAGCPEPIHRAGLRRLWSLTATPTQQFQAH